MRVIFKLNSPCILLMCSTQALDADAEDQQSQNDVPQELQPRHAGSHLPSTRPTLSPRTKPDAEVLPTPLMVQLSPKAPHKEITANSGTK